MKKLKDFKITKKILAILFVIIALFGTAQPIFAVSSSGSGKWVSGQWDSNIYTTDNNKNVGMLLRRLVNYTTGERITVFCAEHFVNSPTGTIENATHSIPTDTKTKRACKIAYFGWYSKYGNYVMDGGILASSNYSQLLDYVFTQQYIWETLGQSSATFKDSSLQSQYITFKANIDSKIDNMQKQPSFIYDTITIDAGTSKTITDTNGVLKDYPSLDKTVDGIRIIHTAGQNTLTITVDVNCSKESYKVTESTMKSWGMVKEGTVDYDTTVYFTFEDGVQNQLYALNYNDPVYMLLDLKINLTGRLELQKLNTNKDLVNGAVYTVTGANDYNKDVTVTNGKIVIENLKKGTYYVKEKTAPKGYLLDTTTYQVEVKVNETATQAIINKEPTGKILIYKVSDNNDKVGGSTFSVSADEDIKNVAGTVTFYKKGQEIAQIISANGTGIAEIEGLPMGRYSVKEVKAPTGYLLNDKSYSAVLEYKDQTTPVVEIKIEGVVNKEPTGTISLIKEDSETGKTPQGDATFNKATYEVSADEDIYNVARTKKFYTKGDIVATRTMNEKGTTDDVTNLPLGRYKVKETKSSEGYLIDTKEYIVELKYKDQNTKVITSSVTSKEVVKKMQVHIFKSGIKTQSGMVQGLEGAEFTIKLASDVEKAYAKGYSYAEVWNGIDEAGNKVSANSKRVQEAQAIAPTYDTVVTDKNGDCYTIELPYGKYIGKETKTPKDFETSTDFYFSITQDKSEVKEIAKKVKDISINNEQLETYIKLIKKDVKTGKTVTASSATFKIRATEDIYDRGNGKILYKKGDTIKQKIGSTTYTTFTTNADNLVIPAESYNSTNDDKGTVVTPLKLEVGSYEIYEVAEPEGFLILQDTVKFKVEGIRNYDQDNDKDYILEIEIKNEQPTGTLLLDKWVALRDNVDKSLIDTSDYSKIKFRLTAKENIIDKADNSVIYEAGTEIGVYNLTKEGTLKVENLPIGSYQIEEIETLDGLVLNDTKYDVIFTQKDNVTKVYEEKLEIENETTIFEFSKTDVTGDKELVGAELKVVDENDEIIDSWTSTEESHKIEGLVVGKEYTMIEEIAVEGYVKATEIKFKVVSTTEIQKVTMIDKIVEISKTDIAGKEIEGASLKVYDKENNIVDEWVSAKEAHKVSGLTEGETYRLHEEVAVGNFVKATDIEFTVTTDKETQKITMIDKLVTVSKVDITTGEELEGASLKVVDEDDNIIDEWVSTKEPTERIEFTVTADKETQKVVMKDMPILTTVKLTKIDEDTKEIIKEKFTFGLYADEECKDLIKQVDSNKKEGTILFEDLRYGIYYIKEISAPNNYILSDRVVKLEINDEGVFIDDEKIEETDSIYNFEFTNKIIETPKTSDDRPLALWFAMLGISGILLCGIGLYERLKNRKKNK